MIEKMFSFVCFKISIIVNPLALIIRWIYLFHYINYFQERCTLEPLKQGPNLPKHRLSRFL